MPTLHQHGSSVITPSINPKFIEVETASWIDYYRIKHGNVKQVWCSPKDRKEPWVCTDSEGNEYTVKPKGGVPHSMIFVM